MNVEAEELLNNNNSNNNTNNANFNPFDTFDIVLVDAQCTHDGSYRHLRYLSNNSTILEESETTNDCNNDLSFSTIQKSHPSLSIHQNENDLENITELEELKQLQRGLIRNGFDRLKCGGKMIYSTCSFQIQQNEEIVQWLLDEINNSTTIISDEQNEQNEQHQINTSNSIHAKIIPLNEWFDGKLENEVISPDESYHPLVQLILSSSDEELFQELSSLYQKSSEEFKLLSNDMCRYFSNIVNPPGREGTIPGTVYYGRWAGTSGLFMACIEKV